MNLLQMHNLKWNFEPKLKVSEIFCSIQGEGLHTGIPSLFLRLSGCNLRCTWCDTPYSSWIPEGEDLSLEKVVEKTLELADGLTVQHVVITGGEPYIYSELPWLVQAFKNAHKTVTVETAGTIFKETNADLISLSPKLSNSTPSEIEFPNESKRHSQLRLNLEVLTQFMSKSADLQLKFVIDESEQINEIEELIDALPPISLDKIFVMPQARDANELHTASLKLVPWCLKKGFRLSTRLHLSLWGNCPGT